jgi:hypothetical protein
MKVLKKWLVLSLILFLPALLTACERELSAAESKMAVAIIEPKVDNFFRGLAEDDYSRFSNGFDAYMLDSIPEDEFSAFRQDLNTHLGGYLSREVHRAVQSDEFYVVEYDVRFEREISINFGVAFHRAEPNTISHIWIETDQNSWAPEPES